MTPLARAANVLDLATGTAVIPTKVVTEGLNDRVHGLDITRSMLVRAKKKTFARGIQDKVHLVCASALEIPYANESFDLVTCALATHHMDVKQLLAETSRILRMGGTLSIGDVGGSRLWKSPVVKFFLRIAAFLYFLVKENASRAWAEAEAVSNVRAPEEWSELLMQAGFQHVKITRLKSKHRWIPEPLVIQATKQTTGGSR